MLGSTIQRELALIILHDLDDPRVTGFPSITRVEVSADLSIADVFVTIMGTPGAQTAALNALKHSAGMMRTRLTKALTLRVAPFIKFHIDEQLRKELDVLSLLEKVKKEDAARHAQHDPESVDSTTDATTDASTDASTEEPTKTEE
jgi:ribosome-binding factor A